MGQRAQIQQACKNKLSQTINNPQTAQLWVRRTEALLKQTCSN